MSEFINNHTLKLEQLKNLIRKLNTGSTPDEVKEEIRLLLQEVPYEDVVAVEQQLFEEGTDRDNMLELCDLHSQALKGLITQAETDKAVPGHPVHTMRKENQALKREISFLRKQFSDVRQMQEDTPAGEIFLKIHTRFNDLMDIEKHYVKKENLIFPFLEKHNITGPSTVMWGKDDQVRSQLKGALEALAASHAADAGEGTALIDLLLEPSLQMIEEMIYKEEQILFPMSLDTLSDEEWYEIYRQSDEIGHCLFEPVDNWAPMNLQAAESDLSYEKAKVKLPSGAFTLGELKSVLNTMPFDFTFVDRDDKVRFFSQGKDRIFQRNKAILGRKVQFCHPPSSVNVVEKILEDFRSGKQDKAAFWINMRGRFIYISYYAVRGDENEYLGTLEVSQDLTELRALEGERRILSYE